MTDEIQEKQRRRRRKKKFVGKTDWFPLSMSLWALGYSVLSFLFLILPVFFNWNRLSNYVTLFYPYVFFIFVAVNVGLALASPKVRVTLICLTALFTCAYTKSYFNDLFENADIPPEQQKGNVRLVTYNWLRSNEEFDLFRDWVEAQSPDIVAIEEKPTVFVQRYSELASLYPHTTPLNNGDDVVILSRFPILQSKTTRLGKNLIVSALIDAPAGKLNVYALHPQTVVSQEQWTLRNAYLSTADLVIEESVHPTVAMGDFNATHWDPLFSQLLSNNHLHAQPRLFPPPTRILNIVAGIRIGAPIDHILVGQDMSLSGCRNAPAMGSDHMPVICDLAY